MISEVPSMESDSRFASRLPTTNEASEYSTVNTNPHLTFSRNRFSNASLLTVSSVGTLLPQYSVDDALQTTSGSTSLQNSLHPPRYSLPIEGEFRYIYPIRSKKPWATLHLHTRDTVPGNPKPLQTKPNVPRFWSCDPMRGTLELDLDSPQNIQQITILLHGNIITSSFSEGSLQFLGREFTLWDKSMGSPRISNDADENRKLDGRFTPGQYTFPFSFPFPTHAEDSAALNTSSHSSVLPLAVERISSSSTSHLHGHVPKNVGKQKWSTFFSSSRVSSSRPDNDAVSSPSQTQSSSRSPAADMEPQARYGPALPMLPQTFMEKGMNHNVAYEISVRIDHGRFRSISKIKTNIIYIPASRPPPTSEKRREAYEAGALLPSPMDNPDGWFAWPTVTTYGVVKSDENLRHTKAECTLYLAQPLSYTRGSVIPCFLTISSDDDEVVRLLSSPTTPRMRLLRCIRHPEGESDRPSGERITELGLFRGGIGRTFGMNMLPNGEMRMVNHQVGRAQWWIPSKGVVQSPNIRHLEGEIHLRPSLQPSCDSRFFQVQYAAELMSFRTDNFEPEVYPSSRGKSHKTDTVLASSPVEITTLYREDEPIPTVYSEPPKINIMRQVNSDDKRDAIVEEDE